MTGTEKAPRIGKLEPRFVFCLNPHTDWRFTRCPTCDKRMRTRKEPFFVHVDPMEMVVLNMTARYCPDCDLLILHQDVVEALLARAVGSRKPELIGNDYLILGTLERSLWRNRGSQPTLAQAIEQLHDFVEVVTIEPNRYRWMPNTDD